VGIGSSYDEITNDFRVDNLDNDVFVCETYNKTVFGGVVFVFGLGDEFLSLLVIGSTFTSSSEFNLEAFEVSFVFDYLDETL
jgi:hypothetical protein